MAVFTLGIAGSPFYPSQATRPMTLPPQRDEGREDLSSRPSSVAAA
ncbi:hypothetical protein [Halomonas icarae]|uniref:Uncharacterized protein n=1 Tax=Halomonas icarae TaxID=2691040 RepID=A0A7X5AMC7_9GAMM|nr:hypothetical protein [Halomonas icarae]MDR5900851.1 hypothetical protein [Halomonas icarae]NAW13681.1 hypothetical protein [Halomonas icarae]